MREIESRRVVTPSSGISRTKQAEGQMSNINAIVARYRSTGQLPAFNSASPRYGDVSSAVDFLTAQAKVRSAQEAFDRLPPNVRSHFKNDPAELLAAVHDPARVDECRKLGLLLPGEEAPPPVVPNPEGGDA